jgi:dTDP-4-amino-4,6-dideoxygalactose transaminase
LKHQLNDLTNVLHRPVETAPDMRLRDSLIIKLAEAKIQAVFHYVPLHSSIYDARLRGTSRSLPFTENLSERLVRIPLWLGVENVQKQIIDVVVEAS